MTSSEIQAKINELEDKTPGAMSDSSRQVWESNHAQTLAMYEVALQVAKLTDAISVHTAVSEGGFSV